jgi:hypothetical protein
MKTSKVVLALTATIIIAADAHAGRWLSRDPIEEGAGFVSRDPKPRMDFTKIQRKNEPNLYAFVRNDPVRFCDAYGLSTADVANMYWAFLTELKDMCVCHLSCPELGWRQNIGAYWGCTRQTENLESVFDKIHFEDQWDITVNYDTSRWPLNHNSVRVKPWNPEDPVVDADTWKGCFSATWPVGSAQQNFKRCFTCKELLKKN